MRRLLCGLVVVACNALALPVFAEAQDFQLYKLGAPGSGGNESFRTFANQLGVAVSSFNLSPPETLGHSAFNFAFEYMMAKVDTDAAVWPTAGNPPSDLLLMPTVHIRKGLPFSFEAGARISYLQFSRMTTASAELKWALNEGLKYFPDLGVRGHATRMLGARDFGLTTAGIDIGIGKQVAIGGMLTLTPYAGWNMVFVDASSRIVDFNPARSLESEQTDPLTDLDAFDHVKMSNNHSNRFYGGLRPFLRCRPLLEYYSAETHSIVPPFSYCSVNLLNQPSVIDRFPMIYRQPPDRLMCFFRPVL
jgi:hypothetical protein